MPCRLTRLLAWLTLAAVAWTLSGCATRTTALLVRDSLPADASKGFVEFVAERGGVVFSVHELAPDGASLPVAKLWPAKSAVTGALSPEWNFYWAPPPFAEMAGAKQLPAAADLPLANRVRFACVPGPHTFTVPIPWPYSKQGDDKVVVQVREGMVTPVKVYCDVLPRVWHEIPYQVFFRPAQPVPLERAR